VRQARHCITRLLDTNPDCPAELYVVFDDQQRGWPGGAMESFSRHWFLQGSGDYALLYVNAPMTQIVAIYSHTRGKEVHITAQP
jgi:hypothetical protein